MAFGLKTFEVLRIAQWSEYLLLDQAAPGLIRSIPKKLQGKNVSFAGVNQRHCLEESGQWLENVDRTHLALPGGENKNNSTKNKGRLFE